MDHILILFVTSVSLILAIKEAFFPSKNIVWRNVSFAILILSILAQTSLFYIERNQTSNLQAELSYSYVSMLALDGLLNGGVSTEISKILGPLIKIDGKNYHPPCSTVEMEVLNKIILDYPKFPFGYALRAMCKKDLGLKDWRNDAKKSRNILRITTKIDGHNQDHDGILSAITKLLN